MKLVNFVQDNFIVKLQLERWVTLIGREVGICYLALGDAGGENIASALIC